MTNKEQGEENDKHLRAEWNPADTHSKDVYKRQGLQNIGTV